MTKPANTKFNTFTRLEAALEAAARDIRDHLQECEGTSHLDFTCEVTGRVHDGDLKVTFRLGSRYDPNSTEGGRLTPVVDEFARRHGWARVNAPVCIGYGETVGEPGG